jgi:SagB-type dehydrogenase family enzyme
MKYKQNREFLKDGLQFDLSDENGVNPLAESDQMKGKPEPPSEKPYNEEDLIYLPDPWDVKLKKRDIIDVLDSRQSRRTPYGEFTLNELSFILWAVYGIRIINNPDKKRTVPSAGARYPFETYFTALDVKGLAKGLYRYIWSKHAIIPVPVEEEKIDDMKRYIGSGEGITLFWSVIPYRGEWCYMQHAHKVAAIDAGHMGQNGYLAAEALGRGCYTIGGYSQADVDRLIGMDGVNEFVCYIAKFM